MKIGISIASAQADRSPRDAVLAMVERAQAANRAGLDSMFVGDHHVTASNYLQNTPMMGRLLAEWDGRDAGALFLLPLWHPVLAAEQIATLASIAHGRFIMQCGLGRGQKTFAAMGTDIHHRPSMFEQSLHIMRSLWRGETVSSSGRWHIEDAIVRPQPPEPIEVWIGASAPLAIERAARLGDAWLADPSMTLPELEQALHVYQDALHNSGRSAKVIALRRDVYIAGSASDAKKALQFAAGYRGINLDSLIIGEIGKAVEQFAAYEALGFTDVIIRNLHPDQSHAIESTERLAEVKSLLG